MGNSEKWFKLNFSGEEINEALEAIDTLDTAVESLKYTVNLKANKDELFSKKYNDLIGKPEIPSIEGLASEEFVVNKIAEAKLEAGNGGNIDVSGFITAEYVDNRINELLDGAPNSLNTLKKLADTLNNNKKDDDAHVANQIIHINNNERAKWNNKFDMPSEGLDELHLSANLKNKLNNMVKQDQLFDIKNGLIKDAFLPVIDLKPYLEKNVYNLFIKEEWQPHVANDCHILPKERDTWNAKYEKPAKGIPAADLEKEIAEKIENSVIKEDVLDDYAMVKKDVLPFDMKIVNGNLRLTIDGVTKIFVPAEGIDYDDIGFKDNIIYGYYMGRGLTLDPKNISVRELEESTTVINKAAIGPMGKTSISIDACPEGATYFVIAPADCGLNVTRDNGIGGKVPFDESLLSGDLNFGCNGVDAELNGVPVKVWGQFMLSSLQMFMYVD